MANGHWAARITPACAGKTHLLPHLESHMQDHPRMRGEDTDYLREVEKSRGSPPHARGRPMDNHFSDAEGRITPACAGKTWDVLTPTPYKPDHPRMRGEDLFGPLHVINTLGSPPHARGRPFKSVLNGSPARITPACAGKTVIFTDATTKAEDHPRMRGEDHSRSR